MAHIAVLVLMLLGSGSAFGQMSDGSERPPGKVIGASVTEHPDWFKQSFLEIADDVEEAAETGKHVLLFFHLEACPYCDKMVKENFEESVYHQYLRDNFDVIAINIKGDREIVFNHEVSLTEKELARHLKVQYTPTIIFLGAGNKPVLRTNGYRSVGAFKYGLDFVQSRAYQTTDLQRFVETRLQQSAAHYTLRQHPKFEQTADLTRVRDRPLMVMFEDASCDECDALHDGILALPETHAILDQLAVIRLDALASSALVDVAGNATTPKAFAAELGITYRPGIVLFDGGDEVLRIDGMLRTFHFQEALRYVAEGHHRLYAELRDYMKVREQEILDSGQDIDIWK